nr:hypothetical protein CFP56_24393 [Quercus suber]
MDEKMWMIERSTSTLWGGDVGMDCLFGVGRVKQRKSRVQRAVVSRRNGSILLSLTAVVHETDDDDDDDDQAVSIEGSRRRQGGPCRCSCGREMGVGGSGMRREAGRMTDYLPTTVAGTVVRGILFESKRSTSRYVGSQTTGG